MGGGVAYTAEDERVLGLLFRRQGEPNAKELASLFNNRTGQDRSDSSIYHKAVSLGLMVPGQKRPKSTQPQPTTKAPKRQQPTGPARPKPVTDYGRNKHLGERGKIPCDRFGRPLDRKRFADDDSDEDDDSDSDIESDIEVVRSEPETVPSSSPTPTIRASSPVPPRDFERSTAPAPSSRDRTSSPVVGKQRSSSRERSASSRTGAAGSSMHAAVSAPTSQAAGTQTQSPSAPGTAQVDTGTATQTDNGVQTVAEREASLMDETMKVARNYESAAAAGELWCAMQRKKLAGERLVEAVNA